MQALQVELGRDPQVEVAVERVVVGGERPRERAAVERLQHRRLDLDEALGVEPLADRGDRRAALAEAARASPGWRSGRARAGGSAARCPRARGTCRAAGAGSSPAASSRSTSSESSPRRVLKPSPSTPTKSPRSSADELLVTLVAEHVGARVELDPPAAVDEVDEGRLALAAPGGDPAGDPVGLLGLLARLEPLVRRADRRRSRPGRRTSCGNGSTPCGAQALELLPPLGEHCGSERSSSSGLCHRGEPNRPRTSSGPRRLRSW